MNRSAAVALMKQGLGFRQSLDDVCVVALQQAQRLVEGGRTLPRFLIVEDAPIAITSGSGAITLPTGFIRVADNRGPYTLDLQNAPKFIEKFEILKLRARFSASAAGRPRGYSLRNTDIVFLPTRDAAYTAYWSYYAQAALLTTDIENSWLQYAPDVLIGRAGMLVAKDTRDKEAYDKFEKLYNEAWVVAFAESELREEAGDPIIMGSNA